jgi:hypothetical protein
MQKRFVTWSVAISFGFFLLAMGELAQMGAEAVGLPPITGFAAWMVVALLGVQLGWRAWTRRSLQRAGQEMARSDAFDRTPESVRESLAELDRTIAAERGVPGHEKALADALEEKVGALSFLDRSAEAQSVLAELMQLVSGSTDASLRARLPELIAQLDRDGRPARPAGAGR